MELRTDAASSRTIAERYSYQVPYVPDVDRFVSQVMAKTVVPYQVEVQPGRIAGNKLCWLSCSYCYGGSSKPTDEHLSPDRYVALMNEMANGPHGGVAKIIFAGYATDPLNYEHIDDLVDTAVTNGQVTGFNTKAIRVSDRLVDILTRTTTPPSSYFNISLDSGSAESYNRVHSIDSKADLYGRVLRNLRMITDARKRNGMKRDISTSYLLTRINSDPAEVRQAINDVREAGADLIRFTFPQVPRQFNDETDTIIPSRDDARQIYNKLKPVIDSMDSEQCRALILDVDSKFSVVPRRVMPCVARFVFPTIGYDGYMYHCSQSAAPQFRSLSLGNLEERGFWDAYYDYNAQDLWNELKRSVYPQMAKLDCRCDRKEQCVNTLFEGYAA